MAHYVQDTQSRQRFTRGKKGIHRVAKLADKRKTRILKADLYRNPEFISWWEEKCEL
jgi:hypothetical protein